jgi:hypothetical protein
MASEEKAMEVKRKYSVQLLQQPGVCGVGVEKDPNQGFVIAVHLDATQPNAGAAIPESLEGLPVKRIRSGPFSKQ